MSSNHLSKFQNKGFSLIEVIVAMALLGVASVAFMSNVNNSQKGQRTIQDNAQFLRKVSSISIALSTSECGSAVKGLGNSALTLTVPNALTLGQNILAGNANLEIEKVSLGDQIIFDKNNAITNPGNMSILIEDAVYTGDQAIDNNASPPVAVVYKKFNSTINITTAKNSHSYGAKTMTESINAELLVDSTGVVRKCGEAVPSEQYVCTQIGGTWLATGIPKCTIAAGGGGDGSGVQADITTAQTVSCSSYSYYICNSGALPCPTPKRIIPQSVTCYVPVGTISYTCNGTCLK